MSRRAIVFVTLGALVVAVSVLAGVAVAGKGNGNDKTFQYAVGLWGDMPYSTVQERVGIPNLLADLNSADIQFSVNDGDLKAGQGVNVDSAPCDDALYERALGWLNSLEQPAMFTPGDNDWTDCDRTTNGGFGQIGSREDSDCSRRSGRKGSTVWCGTSVQHHKGHRPPERQLRRAM